ncbi:MAG: pterin-4-alpha-carbinolamine dehydratase [Pseudonocardiaceae bacterium]|nr:MAG: pterin-4-alpha-carbinolamine dehydratase [Pseudonocardiaceae bacterium]
MTTESPVPEGWTESERPSLLHRRFEFDDYDETRRFLAFLESLSKELGLYPDLSFARTHVRVTVHGPDGGAVGAEEREFAARAGAFSSKEVV